MWTPKSPQRKHSQGPCSAFGKRHSLQKSKHLNEVALPDMLGPTRTFRRPRVADTSLSDLKFCTRIRLIMAVSPPTPLIIVTGSSWAHHDSVIKNAPLRLPTTQRRS